jgi:hypothetical protein
MQREAQKENFQAADDGVRRPGVMTMIQCTDCELCEIGPDGRRAFKCDPFNNIKEPECIAKWQLIRLDMLLASYQGMLRWQKKMEPLQSKMMKYVEREISDIDEAEKWKYDAEESDEPEPPEERSNGGGFDLA